jgi:hypothetical protein
VEKRVEIKLWNTFGDWVLPDEPLSLSIFNFSVNDALFTTVSSMTALTSFAFAIAPSHKSATMSSVTVATLFAPLTSACHASRSKSAFYLVNHRVGVKPCCKWREFLTIAAFSTGEN